MTVPAGAQGASQPEPAAPHDGLPGSTSRPRPQLPPREAVAAMCPYLVSAAGSWRSAAPSRGHRCTATEPPPILTTEKQRRHCLSANHLECPIFREARSSRSALLAAGASPSLVEAADRRRRPIGRTAPILLEPPRLIDQTVHLPFDRAPGQFALVALMVVAFAIVALARLSGGTQPSASPSLLVAVASSSPSPRITPSPTPAPSASGSSAPAPSFRTTYKVKKGDSLAAIAKTFHTTIAQLRELNNLPSVTTLKIGQVLKIP